MNCNTMFFSGHVSKSKNGTGVIVSQNMAKFVAGFNAISDRIITIRIDCNPLPLNIVQIYVPTAESSHEDFTVLLRYSTDNNRQQQNSRRELFIYLFYWFTNNCYINTRLNTTHNVHTRCTILSGKHYMLYNIMLELFF